MLLLASALTSFSQESGIATRFPQFFKQGSETPQAVIDSLDRNRAIYQDLDPTITDATTADGFKIYYIGNSQAFTGRGCSVNKLIQEVGVGSAYVDMGNLIDDDLDNYCTIGQGITVGATVNPLVSVRDSKHYYAKGTTVGFCLMGASGGSSLLSLDVVKALAFGFYRDGKLVGTAPVKEGQNATGVGLSLINIDTDGMLTLTAEAPDLFDEISLDPAGGLNLKATEALSVKYAFAGKQSQLILNRDWETGTWPNQVTHTGEITKFNEANGRRLKIDYATVNESLVDAIVGYDKFVEDPDEGAVVSAVLDIGSKGQAEICIVDEDRPDEEVFPAGTEVGFKVVSKGLLSLGLGSGSYIRFYTKDYKKHTLSEKRDYDQACDDVTLGAGVLDLGLIEIDTDGQLMSAIAPVPFSGFKLFIGSGVEVNLGATYINYAYIREKPEQLHACNLGHTTEVYLSQNVTSHLLTWNEELQHPVKWELLECPEGSAAMVDEDTGMLYNIDTRGTYRLRVSVQGEGHESCFGDVYVHNDQFFSADDGSIPGICGDALVNEPDGEPTYVFSNKIYESEGSGSLISISDIQGVDNILDADTENYAEYTSGLSVADNIRIIGIKRADGSLMSDGSAARRVGFVVEESVDGLNAKVLEFLQIRCYNAGTKVYESPIQESNAVSVQLIGTDKFTKKRYTIVVPEGNAFDEIQLWTSGVLDLTISRMKIYYPFEEDVDTDCSSLLGCNGTMLGATATVVPMQAGAVNVAQVVDNTSFLIDPSYETAMTVQNSVSAGGGVKVLVDLGHMVMPTHNLGLILDDNTYAAGITAGNWLTVRLRNSHAKTAQHAPAMRKAAGDLSEAPITDEFTDWHVANVNVAGYGDKRVMYMTPTQPFDQVELEIATIVGALDTQQFYGLCTRGDSDGDGVPDCIDPVDDVFVLTGIADAAAPKEKTLCVTLHGRVATVVCSDAEIARVLAYGLNGYELGNVASRASSSTAEITLPAGVSILQVLFTDGTARSLKLAVN